MPWRRKWQPTPVFLPGESQGREAWWAAAYGGRTESDTTKSTQQQQQPCREVTGRSQGGLWGYAREGWAAVMKGGAMGAGPRTETSKLATSLEAIFPFFLKTGIDRCLT